VPADTDRDTPRPRRAPSPPELLDGAIDVAIAAGVTVLILIGFASSYRTLRDLATDIGGYPPWLAPAVPLSFDLGIVVLSLKVIRLAREGRSAPILRLQVAALSISTVAANAAAATTPVARLLHVVPPAMFVICFESVVITARRHALERLGRQADPLPRMPIARWLLAPSTTWRVWRSAVLHDSTEAPRCPATEAPRKHEPHPSRRRPATRGRTQRLDVARRALEHAPDLTAVQLATTLAANGYPVSVRTAQRLRAHATALETAKTSGS
jgi:hypothetical protein